jgi:hypothetical protein
MPWRVLKFVSAVALVLLIVLLLPGFIAKSIVAVVAFGAVYGRGPRGKYIRNSKISLSRRPRSGGNRDGFTT